mgnify:CR=1 FL=1
MSPITGTPTTGDEMGERRIDYYQHPGLFQLGQDPKTMPYGPREDGTPKGEGYFGKLPRRDDPAAFSTELSASTDFKVNGRTVLFPLLVPTLTHEEIQLLLSGEHPTDDIYRKAEAFARERIGAGKSPFAEKGERLPVPQSVETDMREGYEAE